MHDVNAFIESVLAEADVICCQQTGHTLAAARADEPTDWKWRMLLQVQRWYGFAVGDVAHALLILAGAETGQPLLREGVSA